MNTHEMRRNFAKAIDRWENEGGATCVDGPRRARLSALGVIRGPDSLRSKNPGFVRDRGLEERRARDEF
jgi:hypothetical protein